MSASDPGLHPQALAEDERTEYAELGEWARHDDSMIYHAAAVLLPLSFGAVAVALQFPKLRFALAFFSIALYLYWLAISVRLSWFSAVRLSRLRELETKAGLAHHRLLAAPPAELRPLWGRRISIRSIRLWGLLVLCGAWLVTLCRAGE